MRETKFKISEKDLKELRRAKELLENPRLAAKITNFIGRPIEIGLESLPQKWSEKIEDITKDALLTAADTAVLTMKNTSKKTSNIFHKTAVAFSGGVGGFFGLPGIVIELPVSTTIMLRSIADISREHGESIKSVETKWAC